MIGRTHNVHLGILLFLNCAEVITFYTTGLVLMRREKEETYRLESERKKLRQYLYC